MAIKITPEQIQQVAEAIRNEIKAGHESAKVSYWYKHLLGKNTGFNTEEPNHNTNIQKIRTSVCKDGKYTSTPLATGSRKIDFFISENPDYQRLNAFERFFKNKPFMGNIVIALIAAGLSYAVTKLESGKSEKEQLLKDLKQDSTLREINLTLPKLQRIVTYQDSVRANTNQ